MPMWMNHRDCVGGNKIRMLMFVGMIGANDMMMMMMTTTMTRQLLGAHSIGDLDNSIASTDAERRNVEMLTSQHEGS